MNPETVNHNDVRAWLRTGPVNVQVRRTAPFACECCRRVLHPDFHAGVVLSPCGTITADVCVRCTQNPDWPAGADREIEPERDRGPEGSAP